MKSDGEVLYISRDGNPHCLHDRIWNHLGDILLAVSMELFSRCI